MKATAAGIFSSITGTLIKVEKQVWVPIDHVVWNWDTRVVAGDADEPREDYISGLYVDKKVTDPIEVKPSTTGIYDGVEGRTRYAALEHNGVKKILVGILTPATEAEFKAYSYLVNCGIKKPPVFEDLKLTVTMLMEEGLSDREVFDALVARESSGRLKKAIDQSRSNRNKQNYAKARKECANSPLPPAERYKVIAGKYPGLKAKTLQRLCEGNTPGGKRNTYLNEVKKDLGKVHNRHSMWLRGRILQIEERHSEDTPTDQALEAYDHLIAQQRSYAKMLEKARARLEMRVNSGKAKAFAAGA